MVESQDTAEMGVATVAGQAFGRLSACTRKSAAKVEEIRQKAENLQRRARARMPPWTRTEQQTGPLTSCKS